MNKTDLVNAIADKTGLTKIDAKKALDAALDAISDAVKSNDKVSLIGFGTFAVIKKAAHKGINPATGQAIQIPEKSVLKFKASSTILD